MIGSRIQRYVLMQCLSALLLVISVLFLSILLVDVVEQLRTVGSDVDLTARDALGLSLMKLPMLMEQTLSFAMLVAAMIAFSRLNRRGELAIIRASGVSAWRFLSPLLILAILLGAASTTLLNPVGARLNASYEQTRANLLREARPLAVTGGRNDIWLRQGDQTSQIVIHAERIEDNGAVLAGVKLLEEERVFLNATPTDTFRFVRRIDAARALIRDGFWQLEDLIENVPGEAPVRREVLSIPTDLDADQLLDRFASPATIGFWALPAFVKQTMAAGLDASRYRMRWHSLLAAPVLFMAMALIGAIVCLRLGRLGGTSQLIAMGGVAAVGLFFVTQLAFSLGSSGAVPPAVAAWSPALFALFTALTVVAYREDG